ncbi:tail protein [Rhizocola hellebori]|uniref:Tail protein n=1 Tax=Rhizocola hellebori TaxID=1392758 RepID=A0A8J3QAE0_9ACTN|nr:phage tail sheath subtilisin-like domain-containing protein [Rhizocola hellebori]GIH06871.1 tail protein [Rhizocola hellebori]
MPVSLSYPGVYVEEISSGVRSVTGVATSITAFVGRARRGPTDEDGPVVVNSYADFERIFGGLWLDSPMTFAVRDFFLNGGAQALIVRIFKPTGEPSGKAKVGLPLEGAPSEFYDLTARYPGKWANSLHARVDYNTKDPLDTKLFNLYVREGEDGPLEEFRNVSVDKASPRRVDKVLKNDSLLVTGAVVGDGQKRPAQVDATKPWSDAVVLKVKTADEGEDGVVLNDAAITGVADRGLYALEKADLFNLLCIPPHASDGDTITDIETTLVTKAATYCEKRRAVLIVDPHWKTKAEAANTTTGAHNFSGNTGTNSRNAAFYFPRLRQPNPLRSNQMESFAPCGAVAGVIARTDAQRGVWKAPAGLDASLVGVPELEVKLTDLENGELNPLGVNCLRVMPAAGAVVWGARTMHGNDKLADEWKYLPVRRTALFIEESLFRGTQWVVFEPNDEPLWAQIRLNVGAFMHDLFRQGAFQGLTPKEAYFVKCDKETTTQTNINNGVVNIVVGFAPLKPAEFVVIKLQQMAGQVAV